MNYVVWFEATAETAVSDNQGLFRDAALAVGHYCFKMKTLEDVEAALQMTLIPFRKVSILGR